MIWAIYIVKYPVPSIRKKIFNGHVRGANSVTTCLWNVRATLSHQNIKDGHSLNPAIIKFFIVGLHWWTDRRTRLLPIQFLLDCCFLARLSGVQPEGLTTGARERSTALRCLVNFTPTMQYPHRINRFLILSDHSESHSSRPKPESPSCFPSPHYCLVARLKHVSRVDHVARAIFQITVQKRLLIHTGLHC